MQRKKRVAGKGWSQWLEALMIRDLERQGWHCPDMVEWTRCASGYISWAPCLTPAKRTDPRGYVLWCFWQMRLVVEELDGGVILRNPEWFDFGVQAELPF